MSEHEVVKDKYGLDGFGVSLVFVVLILCAFKCNGIVLWGPNELPAKCPEVAEP